MNFTTTGQMTDESYDAITAIMTAEDNGENPFNLKHRTAEQIATDVAANTLRTEVAETTTLPAKVGSKKNQAIEIYIRLEDQSRSAVIAALVENGFNKTTASTYAYNLINKW